MAGEVDAAPAPAWLQTAVSGGCEECPLHKGQDAKGPGWEWQPALEEAAGKLEPEAQLQTRSVRESVPDECKA